MKNEVYLKQFIIILEQVLKDETSSFVKVDGTILNLSLIPKLVLLGVDF